MYMRDESKKHNASVGVILVSPVILVALIVGFIFGVFGVLGLLDIITTDVTFNLLVSGVLIIIGVIWDCICKYYYNFYENCKLDIKNNSIIYTYDLNGSIIASSDITTKVTVKTLKKFKLKGKSSIILYGDIIKKAPLKKNKNLSKIELPIDFKERNEIIEKLNKISEVKVC